MLGTLAEAAICLVVLGLQTGETVIAAFTCGSGGVF